MFESIFSDGNIAAVSFFIALSVALVCGIIYAFLACRNSRSSMNFAIATALIPMTVAAVIALVKIKSRGLCEKIRKTATFVKTAQRK